MTARRSYIFTNKYISPAKKTDLKWYERDLNTWYNEMKYKEATGNPNQYFSNVKFVNLDIIYHGIRKTKLKSQLRNIRKFIKMTSTDTTKNLRIKCLVQLIDPNVRIFFFEKDLDRNHFFEKYPHVELSTMKKRFKKNNRPLQNFTFLIFLVEWQQLIKHFVENF